LTSIDGYRGYTVAIGGIHLENAEELMVGASTSGTCTLNGLAVVSAIIGASDPKAVCEKFVKVIRAAQGGATRDSVHHLLSQCHLAIKNIRAATPMVHHITSKYLACNTVLGYSLCFMSFLLLLLCVLRQCGDQ
jgi:thiamine-phosphate diphosphorylase/hydroxyethylthiazole kinase